MNKKNYAITKQMKWNPDSLSFAILKTGVLFYHFIWPIIWIVISIVMIFLLASQLLGGAALDQSVVASRLIALVGSLIAIPLGFYLGKYYSRELNKKEGTDQPISLRFKVLLIIPFIAVVIFTLLIILIH